MDSERAERHLRLAAEAGLRRARTLPRDGGQVRPREIFTECIARLRGVAITLVTIGTAATDVACFTRLGSVFASVMTSNLVFLGLSAARHSGMLAGRASISVAAYVIGVAASSRLARTGQRAGAPDDPGGSARPGGSGGQPWSAWIAATLLIESVLLAAFTAGWEITGAKPEGGAQLLLLAAAAAAMGIQSGVVAVLVIAGVVDHLSDRDAHDADRHAGQPAAAAGG